MPIEGISDIRRLPRLGKIRLGIKVAVEGKNPYPRATDYFVVPDDITEYVGEKPKKLNIMFPTEDVEKFAQQWLRCYSFTQGQICKGNGVTALRKVDAETGDIARHTTEEWIFRDGWTCNPEECPQYLSKQCRRVMNLLFLMPAVPGFGCWQLDTTSFYSIVNINSCVDLIRSMCGRISFIPLILALEPKEVSPPGIKTKTVHILTIRSEMKLAEIQRVGRTAPQLITMPTLDEEEAPEDLYPDQKIIEAPPETPAAETTETVESPEGLTPEDITKNDVPSLNSLFTLCNRFWKMQPADVCWELGYSSMLYLKEADISPWTAWLTIKEIKQQKRIMDPRDLTEEDFPDASMLITYAKSHFELKEPEMWKELSYTSLKNFQAAGIETPWECWKKLRDARI